MLNLIELKVSLSKSILLNTSLDRPSLFATYHYQN